MKNSTHKEALEILKPMIKNLGTLEMLCNKHYDGMFKPIDGCMFKQKYGAWKTQHFVFCNSIYIPTLEQLWEQVLKFNDEQYNLEYPKYRWIVKHDTKHGTDMNTIYMEKYEQRNLIRCWMNKYPYTDTMYLALLKICVEIWKIRQVTT